VSRTGPPQKPPWVEPSSAFARSCEKSNPTALKAIGRLKPEIVFLAQQNAHDGADWEKLAARLKALAIPEQPAKR